MHCRNCPLYATYFEVLQRTIRCEQPSASKPSFIHKNTNVGCLFHIAYYIWSHLCYGGFCATQGRWRQSREIINKQMLRYGSQKSIIGGKLVFKLTSVINGAKNRHEKRPTKFHIFPGN